MIDEILKAILDESRAYLASIADDTIGMGMVIKKTNITDESKNTYTYPLLMIGVIDGVETSQYCGGTKRADWMFDFSTYHYGPDVNADDESTYSTSLIKIVEQITNHFSAGLVNDLWLTQGMRDIYDNYEFQFTLLGMSRADPLDATGVANGWKTNMDSIGIDYTTNSIVQSTEVLEHVVADYYPPADDE